MHVEILLLFVIIDSNTHNLYNVLVVVFIIILTYIDNIFCIKNKIHNML